MHIAVVGILLQGVYFGMCWFSFSIGISAGVVAIIMLLQPILIATPVPARVKSVDGAVSQQAQRTMI